MIAARPVLQRHHAGARQRHQQHTARLQRAVRVAQHALHVVDQVDRLRQDETVVGILRHLLDGSQVGHDCRAMIAGIDVEDVGAAYAVAAVARRELGIQHLQHVAVHVGGVPPHEDVNEMSIDRHAAIEPPVAADRRGAAQVLEFQRPAPVGSQLFRQFRERPRATRPDPSRPARARRAAARHAREAPRSAAGGRRRPRLHGA